MFTAGALALLGWVAGPTGTYQAVGQERDAAADVEVLAHGPVHEAFAEPVAFDPTPGEIVNNRPPEPIEELPPDTKPEGENVEWISGYWNWDDDTDKFLWVSGFWRDIPPGREWVPGYWTKISTGWQWVAGYWASTEEEEVTYLPAPPESLESGPSTPAPSTNYIWVPGTWMWNDVRYSWRPGYWMVGRSNWIWVPSRYCWTPGGYVFVNGYWDWPVARRGILFAPVAFGAPVYGVAGYRYTPSAIINVSLFTNYLFVRPRYGCYYFGDYFAPRYANSGFYAWSRFHSGRHGYDPLYVHSYHQHVHVHKQRDWEERLRQDYARRVDNEDTRPPRKFDAAIAATTTAKGGAELSKMGLVTTMDSAKTATDLPVKLEKINENVRRDMGRKARETNEFAREREKIEVADAGNATGREGRRGRPDDDAPAAKTPERAKTAESGAVRTVERRRSPVGDKATAETSKARDLPPRPTPPAGAGKRTDDRKPDDRKPDDDRGRGKPGGTRGKSADDDDNKPSPKERDDPPRTKPRDVPRTETPKPDPPRTKPRTETPKPTPRTETPKPTPRTETPQPRPRTETPKPTPRTEPPRSKPRTESPKPSNSDSKPKKGRRDNASSFEVPRASSERSVIRQAEAREEPRVARPEPRPEPRVARPEPRSEPKASRPEPRSERSNRSEARPERGSSRNEAPSSRNKDDGKKGRKDRD